MRKKIIANKKCAEIIINLLVFHLWTEFIIESLAFLGFLSVDEIYDLSPSARQSS